MLLAIAMLLGGLLAPGSATPARAADPQPRDLWVRNGTGGHGSGTEADPYYGLAAALASARPGDTIKLKEDVTVTGSDTSVLVDKAVTIDGLGHTLRLRGQDLELAAEVTVRSTNLALMRDGGAPGTIYLSGHKVVLDQVTTRVSTGQRPHIVTGTKGGRACGPQAHLVVTNATDETRFTSITAGDLDSDSATPVTIDLASTAVRVDQGIHLALATTRQTGRVDVTTQSNFVTAFHNPARPAGAGERSVTFNGTRISGVTVADLDNLSLTNGARVSLGEADQALGVSTSLRLEQTAVLDLGGAATKTGAVNGAGLVRIGDTGSFESGTTDERVSYEVYRPNFDYREHIGKAYIITHSPALNPALRLLPEGAPYQLRKDAAGTWRLEEADTAAKVPVTGTVRLTENGLPKAFAAGDFVVTVRPEPENDPVEGVPAGEVPVTSDGKLDLGTWKLDQSGVYRFTITQVNRAAQGITYDLAPVRLTITVTESPDPDAPLVARTTWHKNGAEVPGLVLANTYTEPAGARTDPGGFVAVTPVRLLDTRETRHPMVGGEAITLPLRGGNGIPADASAVALNITSTETHSDGFVIAWPTGGPQPASSHLNPVRGRSVPNHVIVAMGDDGTISIMSATTTHLVVDLMGYYRAPAAEPTPGSVIAMPPARLVDTRETVAVAPRGDLEVQVTGRHGVPASAAAVFVNLTVTEPGAPGWLAGYPTGQPLPLASNVNFVAGQTVSNAAWLTLGEGGKVTVRNGSDQTVHMVVDVSAYAVGGTVTMHGGFVPLAPRRLLDTRESGAVPAGGTSRLDVAGLRASAVALNVTVTEPGASGFLSVYPADEAVPTASILNYVPGQTVPNLTQVLVGSDGAVAITQRSPASAHIVADLAGYYTQ